VLSHLDDQSMPPHDTHPKHSYSLYGHDSAQAEILAHITGNTLGQSWLITGPKGIGKATFAFHLSRFMLKGEFGGGLFAGSPDTLAVAKDDPTCMRIASGGHADFLYVERQYSDAAQTKKYTAIRVDDVRAVGAFLSKTAAEGGWRVVVIDAADEMNRNAANAILKVLEEPPPHALMLLVAHNPARLLPTIRSRCRQLSLKPLSSDIIARILHEKIEHLSEDESHILQQLADGSAGRAISMHQQGGLAVFEQVMDALAAIKSGDNCATFAIAGELAHTQETFSLATTLILWWLGAAVTGLLRAWQGMHMPEAAKAHAMAILPHAPPQAWSQLWQDINALLQKTDSVNLDKQHVLHTILMQIQQTACITR
jgi:DNA polymerase-3 subunit delta'